MHTDSTVELPTLDEFPAIAAENNPNQVAYGAGADGRTVTWGEFDERSNRAANAFGEHVAQGDRVAFLCEGSVDHVTAWNGALKAGAVVSHLHVRASPETISYCVDALRPRADPDGHRLPDRRTGCGAGLLADDLTERHVGAQL